jgi:uncharacterized membrane protein YidH (DUF202 family)
LTRRLQRGQHRCVLVRRIVGVVLVLMGGVWFFQGIGVIQSKSFMTNNSTWVLIGAVVAIVGVVLIWPWRTSK